MVIQSGEIESTGRVELNPADPKTERTFTINLGELSAAILFRRQTWALPGVAVLLGITMIGTIRQKVSGEKGKGFDGEQKKRKSRTK